MTEARDSGGDSQYDPREAIREGLRDAAYTAIGLGVMAYRFGEPRIKKLMQMKHDCMTRHDGTSSPTDNSSS